MGRSAVKSKRDRNRGHRKLKMRMVRPKSDEDDDGGKMSHGLINR